MTNLPVEVATDEVINLLFRYSMSVLKLVQGRKFANIQTIWS